jgi:hypothetical protein
MTGLALQAILGSSCVALFVFAAEQEEEPRWLWGGLSLGIWLLCWLGFEGGIGLTLLGQVVLFAAMWAWLLFRPRGRAGGRVRR